MLAGCFDQKVSAARVLTDSHTGAEDTPHVSMVSYSFLWVIYSLVIQRYSVGGKKLTKLLSERNWINRNWKMPLLMPISTFGDLLKLLPWMYLNSNYEFCCCRDEAKQLIEMLDTSNVPLIVFSAGIAAVIEIFFQQNLGRIPDNVHIISNLMDFDPQTVWIHCYYYVTVSF